MMMKTSKKALSCSSISHEFNTHYDISSDLDEVVYDENKGSKSSLSTSRLLKPNSEPEELVIGGEKVNNELSMNVTPSLDISSIVGDNESMRNTYSTFKLSSSGHRSSQTLRIETPKTSRRNLNDFEVVPNYQKVNLLLPVVQNTMGQDTKKTNLSPPPLPYTELDTLVTLTDNDSSEGTAVDKENEPLPGVSVFTSKVNSKVHRIWDYLSDENTGIQVFQSDKKVTKIPSISPKNFISRTNSWNEKQLQKWQEQPEFIDIYKEVTSLIDNMKEDQEQRIKRETIVGPASKKRQYVIKKKVEAIRERVDQRLSTLLRSEEEYAKLEKEIMEYEQKTKIAKTIRKNNNDLVRKNKYLSSDYKQHREHIIKGEKEKIDQKVLEVKSRRRQIDQDHVKRKEDIALREERKRKRAEKRREEALSVAVSVELKIKWEFLVVFMSRYLRLASELTYHRRVREEEEKHRRLNVMIYSKIMPIVWKRRSIQWKSAWDVFKKHWIFYRLYLEIKRKKESTMMIRTFLQDTNTSLLLVRQVHMFRSKVFFAQRLIRRWYNARETRITIASFQYSIVEAKMLKGEPLRGQKGKQVSEETEKKKTRKLGSAKRKSSSISLKSDAAREEAEQKKKKKGVTFADEDEDDKRSEYVGHTGTFSLTRATSEIKRELITQDLRRRRLEYDEAMATFKKDKKNYEHKLQQQMYFQKARNIMKNQDSKSNLLSVEVPSSFMNENGMVIIKPTMPVYKIWRTEEEIQELVIQGNKKLQEMEEQIKNEIYERYQGENDRRQQLEKTKACIQYEIKEELNRMRNFFSPKIFDTYQNYFLLEDKEGSDGRSTPIDPSDNHKKKKKRKMKRKLQ